MKTRIPAMLCWLATPLVLAGCLFSADQGGSESRVILSEIASRLDSDEIGSYTATYRLQDGSELTVSIDPDMGRAAVVRDDQASLWTREDNSESLRLWLKVELHNILPTGRSVQTWLEAATTDDKAKVEFDDVTLAGERSDCIHIQGATDSEVENFNVCVTAIGVITRVDARTPQGQYSATLVDYRDGVGEEWFRELEEDPDTQR
ncbi:hypothetical protein [Haloglycomyces albus]|uniref:hypothetical protein n=1 Tax=Haloglycomyces albus TaxID=526067 RepID=UPI0004BA3003|nr:hypothetical protein [Haloglycomyces albus]